MIIYAILTIPFIRLDPLCRNALINLRLQKNFETQLYKEISLITFTSLLREFQSNLTVFMSVRFDTDLLLVVNKLYVFEVYYWKQKINWSLIFLGSLDEHTLSLMMIPRCGVKDKLNTGVDGRSKRYALQGIFFSFVRSSNHFRADHSHFGIEVISNPC